MTRLTVAELALWQRANFPHTLIDTRRAAKRRAEGDQIAGGRWLDPAVQSIAPPAASGQEQAP